MSSKNGTTLMDFIEPPETDDLPENLAEIDGVSLPEHWQVEGPNATASKSRYYLITGKFVKKYGSVIERGVSLVQLGEDSDWTVKRLSANLGSVDAGEQSFHDALETALKEVEEINKSFLTVEHIEPATES